MATSDTYFSQIERRDVVADLGIDSAAPAGRVERFDARGAAAIVFSEYQSLHRARLHDDAGPADGGADIGDAAHQRFLADDRPQHVVLLHPVLKRDDGGRRLHERQQLARGRLGVPQLDAEHHRIDGTDGLGIVGHVDLGQVDRLRAAFDGEPALAHGGKMCAARDEMNISTPLNEPRAEIPADASRAHDRNSQRVLQRASP